MTKRRTRAWAFARSALMAMVMLLWCARAGIAQDPPTRFAIVVGGLGGGAEQTDRFAGYLRETRSALVESLGFEETNVRVLGEQAIVDRPFVDDVSLAENVVAALQDVARRAGQDDEVYVVLFGHGSVTGDRAYLNIPRRDLSDLDYADALAQIPARRIVFVNTASSSSPFLAAIAADGRIVVTATRVPSQRNETTFPEHFVDALTAPGADRDRDGSLSVLEVFMHAAEKTDQAFADAGHIPTENALLDDDGDGEGSRVTELSAAGEGNLAAVTFLRDRGREAVALAASLPEGDRQQLAQRLARRAELLEAIAGVKSEKQELDEDAYYDRLEVLFVELARLEEALNR